MGKDNIFIFGLDAREVAALKGSGYNPWDYYPANAELKRTLGMIASGYFSPEQTDRFQPLANNLTHGGDHYLLLADYAAYVAAQERVEALYRNQQQPENFWPGTRWTHTPFTMLPAWGNFPATVRSVARKNLGCKTGA